MWVNECVHHIYIRSIDIHILYIEYLFCCCCWHSLFAFFFIFFSITLNFLPTFNWNVCLFFHCFVLFVFVSGFFVNLPHQYHPSYFLLSLFKGQRFVSNSKSISFVIAVFFVVFFFTFSWQKRFDSRKKKIIINCSLENWFFRQ